jgi:hypothetical protein
VIVPLVRAILQGLPKLFHFFAPVRHLGDFRLECRNLHGPGPQPRFIFAPGALWAALEGVLARKSLALSFAFVKPAFHELILIALTLPAGFPCNFHDRQKVRNL